MSKVLLVIGLFFGVVIFFRMRNERIEHEAKQKEMNDVEEADKE